MNKIIVLDTGVLGIAVHGKSKTREPLVKWMYTHVKAGNSFLVPEIADYELRRELIRMKFTDSLNRLDELKTKLGYLPINTEMMIRAASLWAKARSAGKPMTYDHALDGDAILCAQTLVLTGSNQAASVVVATTNVGHLSQFVDADAWERISP